MTRIFIFSLLAISLNVNAQLNLVTNPSFEQYSSCPTGLAQANKATGWNSFNSAEYFNVCATSTDVQVPVNYMGYQNAATGNAYCGFFAYFASVDYHEFLYSQLLSNLIIGQKYFVSFKVSPADSGFCVYSNKTGIKFFKALPNSISLSNSAQIYTNSIITDTSNWTKISGSFVADSSYKYIVIGNFFSDANTDIIDHNCGVPVSYYYIDDICVSVDSLTCISILPVNLLTFRANPCNKFVQLFWETAQEENNKGFEVLRSEDLKGDFKKIGYVSGVGYSSTARHYDFTDKNVRNNVQYYYRLKQIDLDNQFSYSSIQKVKVLYTNEFDFIVKPNPIKNELTLFFDTPVQKDYTLKITNNLGKVILYKSYMGQSESTLSIDMQNFAAGFYFVQITNDSQISVQKIIKL